MRRIAHLLQQKTIDGKKTLIKLGAIVPHQRLIRAPSHIIDAKKSGEKAIGSIPAGGTRVIGDAIIRHERLVIRSHKAIVYAGAVAG